MDGNLHGIEDIVFRASQRIRGGFFICDEYVAPLPSVSNFVWETLFDLTEAFLICVVAGSGRYLNRNDVCIYAYDSVNGGKGLRGKYLADRIGGEPSIYEFLENVSH
jgi:hypothetical protein